MRGNKLEPCLVVCSALSSHYKRNSCPNNKIAKQTNKHPRTSHSKNITIVTQNTAVWLPEYVYISIRRPTNEVLLTSNVVTQFILCLCPKCKNIGVYQKQFYLLILYAVQGLAQYSNIIKHGSRRFIQRPRQKKNAPRPLILNVSALSTN